MNVTVLDFTGWLVLRDKVPPEALRGSFDYPEVGGLGGGDGEGRAFSHGFGRGHGTGGGKGTIRTKSTGHGWGHGGAHGDGDGTGHGHGTMRPDVLKVHHWRNLPFIGVEGPKVVLGE